MHVINCAKIGADVMTGPFIINHWIIDPLTDTELLSLLQITKRNK